VVGLGSSGKRRRLRPRGTSGSYFIIVVAVAVVSGDGDEEKVLVEVEVGGVALLDRVEIRIPCPGMVGWVGAWVAMDGWTVSIGC
jgi:hypothetical protein